VTGAYYSQPYAGNGCFDTYLSVGGSQPSGFTQYKSMYGFYLVSESTIDVTASRSDGATGHMVDVGVFPLSAQEYVAGVPTSIPQAREQPYYNTMPVFAYNSGKSMSRTVAKMSTSKIQGERNIRQPNYYGTGGANPVAVWAWIICYQQPVPIGGISYDLTFSVKISYQVEWSGRLVGSLTFLDGLFKKLELLGGLVDPPKGVAIVPIRRPKVVLAPVESKEEKQDTVLPTPPPSVPEGMEFVLVPKKTSRKGQI
jgi:hypothetical protein